MQAELRRSMFMALDVWRTVLLVIVVGLLTARLTHDAIAVLFTVFACAFVFRSFERRQWLVMPMQSQAADITLRVAIAMLWTYTLCNTEIGHLLVDPAS